jgi:hypothetical protein
VYVLSGPALRGKRLTRRDGRRAMSASTDLPPARAMAAWPACGGGSFGTPVQAGRCRRCGPVLLRGTARTECGPARSAGKDSSGATARHLGCLPAHPVRPLPRHRHTTVGGGWSGRGATRLVRWWGRRHGHSIWTSISRTLWQLDGAGGCVLVADWIRGPDADLNGSGSARRCDPQGERGSTSSR